MKTACEQQWLDWYWYRISSICWYLLVLVGMDTAASSPVIHWPITILASTFYGHPM